MDCTQFRNQHLAFLDHTLADAELVAMQRHLAECEACARRDRAIRQGLLIFRNLPEAEPSPDFFAKLTCRLQQVDRAEARAATYRGPGLGSFAALAASVLLVGFAAASLFDWTEPARDLALPPVIAMEPAAPPPPMVHSGLAATAAAGMPMWPALMLVEQAPAHFASLESQMAEWAR